MMRSLMIKLISVTPEAEKTIGYVARVSNPNNQENPKVAGLLKYCIQHQHWSIFEQAFMTVEIETTRGLAAQILRHRSFTFQEFSQRYADTNLLADEIPMFDLRSQDLKIVRIVMMMYHRTRSKIFKRRLQNTLFNQWISTMNYLRMV